MNFKTSNTSIQFTITENIAKLGIKKFILKDKDFEITWSNERKSCIEFNPKETSIEKTVKKIEKKLSREIQDKDKINAAISDIEDQLINKRDDIFNLNVNKEKNEQDEEIRSKFLEDVSKLREEFEKSPDPFTIWQQQVKKKYQILKENANSCFPDSWQLLQFCLAVKSIQNIYGNDLPFIGFILYKASSLKSTIIDLFQKYPLALYADDLTKSSFQSHYSTNNEEQLQHYDLIPKMKDKLLLTSEIAPIINTNEDDLRKIIGIITRLIDGKGYQSHSGTHGHRSYPPMMFTWIGAGIEIPPKMWTILFQAGFKLYFFRPMFKKKTVEDLKKIIKDDNLLDKKQLLENALLEYLKVFDAAPKTNEIVIDESGNPKIMWNSTKDKDVVLDCISNVANLLASLRGIVNTSYSKRRESIKINNNNNNDYEDDNEDNKTKFLQTEQIEYDIEKSATEDASRASIQLKNLARSNALSQGRNYLTIDDAKLITTVGFSTTKIYRAKVIDLLLKNNGELTTSQISEGLQISKPHATRTMLEFDALKIAQVSTLSSYGQSEKKIKLNDEYKWFLTDEFKQIYQPLNPCNSTIKLTPDLSLPTISYNMNSQYLQIVNRNVLNNTHLKTCDTNDKNCHMSKQNSDLYCNKKNIFNDHTENNNENCPNNNQEYDNNVDKFRITSTEDNLHNNNTIINQNDNNTDTLKIKEKNTSLKIGNLFTRVTPSHEKCYAVNKTKQFVPEGAIEDILKVIKDENGQIALNYALQLSIQKSEMVKEFLQNEKLTARASRKVRNIFVEINRHRNIQVVKRKPQLVVRWVQNEEMIQIENR